MGEKRALIGPKEESIWHFVDLPDYFSLTSIAFSLLSMDLSIKGEFEWAVFFIFISGLLDSFDGMVARFINRRGQFGAELDSIADVVAFGVAPAVFGYCIGLSRPLDFILLTFFVLSSALRLARFNIMKVAGDYFIGIPTTSNGFVIPLLFFILKLSEANWAVYQVVFLCWFAFATIMMISTLKVPKPHIGG